MSDEAAGFIGSYASVAALLGTRTAELHRTLATIGDSPSFVPEPFSAMYQRSAFQTIRNQTSAAFALLRGLLDELPAEARPAASAALSLAPSVLPRVRELTTSRTSAMRIRTHGDFHAGQVLWTGKDVVIIDFEGEPGRPLSERRHKRSALSDVAGMLRSFHYAAYGTLLNPHVGGTVRPEDVARLEPWAAFWYRFVAATFLRAYLEAARGQPFLPADDAELETLLELSILQKTLYELAYELNNRPDWVSIPLRGLLDLFGVTADDPAVDSALP